MQTPRDPSLYSLCGEWSSARSYLPTNRGNARGAPKAMPVILAEADVDQWRRQVAAPTSAAAATCRGRQAGCARRSRAQAIVRRCSSMTEQRPALIEANTPASGAVGQHLVLREAGERHQTAVIGAEPRPSVRSGGQADVGDAPVDLLAHEVLQRGGRPPARHHQLVAARAHRLGWIVAVCRAATACSRPGRIACRRAGVLMACPLPTNSARSPARSAPDPQ